MSLTDRTDECADCTIDHPSAGVSYRADWDLHLCEQCAQRRYVEWHIEEQREAADQEAIMRARDASWE